MKIPKKIKLGCYTIEIIPTDVIGLEIPPDGPEDIILGRYTYLNKTIEIKKDLSSEMKQETLLHECMHACLAEYCVDPEIEETVIRLMSPKLVELFKRNPKLIKTIFGKEELS